MNRSTSAAIDGDTLRSRLDALRHQGRLHAGHWVIVCLSVAITFFAWHTSHSALEERSHRRFLSESERVIGLVQERLRHYEDALLSAVAAMQAQGGEMSRERWRLYADYLNLADRYPGVSGISVIHHVEADERDDYVARQRSERPERGFSLHPEHELDFHLPVAYIEPEAANAKAIGLDIAFERNRRDSALRARRLGASQITGPITLVQDTEKTPGFLFFAPYYDLGYAEANLFQGADSVAYRENSFRGLISVPLVVRSLVAGVLGRENRQVSFSISDGEELLYGEEGSRGEAARSALFSHSETLPLYGREWTFDVYSTPAFNSAFGTNQPLLVLVCGLAIDAMLLMLFALMGRSNRRVLKLAEGLTNDLSAQAAALGEKNRDLENFAHVVSHDLKTPIRGIADLADFLEEDLGGYLASNEADPGVGRNLERLREQARKGNALISGILDYSVVGLENEKRSLVDSRRMVESIGATLGLSPGKLVIDGEMPVFRTQATSLEQVLANLIGNSFKYNPDIDGAVTTVSSERHGDYFRFSVADNGPGIEPRFHERVFKAFTTLEEHQDIDSSGIGLSIVKKAVEILGGVIELDSEPGRGSTFRFTWPTEADDDTLRRAA